jgi:serine/threonine protein kinase
METQVIELDDNGTPAQADKGATQIIGGGTTDTNANYTGGLLQIHEQVAGWEVTGKLGTQSGEADIYLAEKDGQKGIIKYYRTTLRPKQLKILEQIKGLNHPDIIKVYDFGMHNERFYEIMEYAAGGALDDKDGDKYRYLPLPEPEAAEICKEVVNSFKTCHELGIIHRDIKPSNIYFRNVTAEEVDDGGVKKIIHKGSDAVVADFGISSIMDEAEMLEQQHKTQTASLTYGYAAPEVISGDISPKMDYYALGITLWMLLTGRDPFVNEEGRKLADGLIIRNTIEGRTVDAILSMDKEKGEHLVNDRMARLIRGLLLVDPKSRWGYDEVTRYLAGEDVELAVETKKIWDKPFPIGDEDCYTLEDLGSAIMKNPQKAEGPIFSGRLSKFLEDYYREKADQINQIVDETSKDNDHGYGILETAFLLNPGIPLEIANGYKVTNKEEAILLLDTAPESIVPLLRNPKSAFYAWLDKVENGKDMGDEIKNLPGALSGGMGDTELAAKAAVILMRKIIKPFKLAKYKDFELSTLDQIRKVPTDMQKRTLTLIKEKSYDGLFLPWFDLLTTDIRGGYSNGPDIDALIKALRARDEDVLVAEAS